MMIKIIAYDKVPLTFFSGDGFKTLNGLAAEKLGIALGKNAF